MSRSMLFGSRAQLTRLLAERDLSFQCSGGVNAVAYDGPSRSVVSGDEAGEVRVWDLISGNTRQSMSCTCPVNAVVCVPEQKAIASGSADGKVTVWDAASGECRLEINSGALPVKAMAYVPRLKALVVASGGHGVGNVMALDPKTGERRLKVLCEEDPLSLSCVEGSTAIVAGNGKMVTVWTAPGGERLWEVCAGEAPVVGVAHADGLGAVISGDERGSVVLWEAKTGTRRLGLSCSGGTILALAYAADLGAVIVAGSGRCVHSYDVVTGASLQRLSCGYVARSMQYSEELQAVVLGHHLEGRRLSALVSPSGRTGMVKVLPVTAGGQELHGGPEAPDWADRASGPLL